MASKYKYETSYIQCDQRRERTLSKQYVGIFESEACKSSGESDYHLYHYCGLIVHLIKFESSTLFNVHCTGMLYKEGDGTWCRYEIEYYGSGRLYCNSSVNGCQIAMLLPRSSTLLTKSPRVTSSGTNVPT